MRAARWSIRPERGEHRVRVYRKPVHGHPRSHGAQPRASLFPQPGLFGNDGLCGGIEQVSQQVHRDPPAPAGYRDAGELRTPDQPQSCGQCADGFVPSRCGVVIGERDHVKPSCSRSQDQLGGSISPIGHAGVGVQIDTHVSPVLRPGHTSFGVQPSRA